jgi:MFS transporter, PCFT/HCP family, solute carrier family 46, member 3
MICFVLLYIFFRQIGFYGIFTTAAILYLFAIFYGVIYVVEKEADDEKRKIEKNYKSFLSDFFDREHVMETIKVAFKTGENQRRLRVIMLLIVVMVVIGPLHGEMSVMYLFTRYKFNWSEIEFSFFSTYAMIIGLIGTLVSIGLFSHVLKFDDAIIGVLSSMSKVISSFVYAFAVTTWQFYIGPIAEILNGTSFIAMRSIGSKLVPKDELVS